MKHFSPVLQDLVNENGGDEMVDEIMPGQFEGGVLSLIHI